MKKGRPTQSKERLFRLSGGPGRKPEEVGVRAEVPAGAPGRNNSLPRRVDSSRGEGERRVRHNGGIRLIPHTPYRAGEH